EPSPTIGSRRLMAISLGGSRSGAAMWLSRSAGSTAERRQSEQDKVVLIRHRRWTGLSACARETRAACPGSARWTRASALQVNTPHPSTNEGQANTRAGFHTLDARAR